MNAAATSSDDGGEHMRLRAAAQQAELELKVLEARIAQHRESHGSN